MQRSGEAEPDEATWLRDATGGSVYLRLSTRPIEQPKRTIDAELSPRTSSTAPTGCASPGRMPRSSSPIPGAVAPEAIEAVGLMAEDRRDVGLLAVTSADRLNAGWTAAQRAREHGLAACPQPCRAAARHVPSHCGLVTVIDGHPATLAWLGAVHGHRTRSLGVEHFGQTGTIADLYRHSARPNR